jgi:hypothetical protein
MTSQPDDVIATRQLDVLEDGRVIGVATVSLGRPRQEPEGEWSCSLSITGIGRDSLCPAAGDDAVQALGGAILLSGGVLAGHGSTRWQASAHAGIWTPTAVPLHGADAWIPGLLDVIAERTIDMLDEQGKPREVFRYAWRCRSPDAVGRDSLFREFPRESTVATVSIGRPLQAPSGAWACPYRVRALDVEQSYWAWGFDGIHALRGALLAVGIDADAVTEQLINLSIRQEELAEIGFPVTRDPPGSPAG